MPRIPLSASMESRDGTRSKDAQVINGVVEVRGDTAVVRKRPGVADQGNVGSGTAQLIYYWNGLKAIISDTIYSGSVTTITSGPSSTALSSANTGLQFSAQETNSDAATPLLFFKNRTQAWTINRANTVASVSLPAGLGTNTYTLVSLTRSGGTATATLTDDVFNVGDSVVIAGATPIAYNGTQTVTAVTTGSSTPARAIPITVTRSGTTATAVTADGLAHGLTTATAYTISGANESAYNGSKTITLTGTTSFTYTVTVTPASSTTLNPADKAAGVTLSGGNLTLAGTASAGGGAQARATSSKSTGKWYYELTINSTGDFCLIVFGVSVSGYSLVNSSNFGNLHGDYGSAGDIYGIEVDLDGGTISYYKNGGSILPNRALSSLTYFPHVGLSNFDTGVQSINVTVNFGATAFAYTPSSGFSAWSTDDPTTPATGTIIITDPARTVNPTFSFTIGGSPATPATGTITAQSSRGMVPGVAYVNGYFGIMDTNGVVYTSNTDDPTTWGALSFLTAQYRNGDGKAITSSQNYMIALKEYSTEYFYDAQNGTGSPFLPVENGFTEIGCASGDSVASIGGKIIFISQTRSGKGRSAHVMLGMQQEKISTPDIERILDQDSLATVYAYGLTIDGHELYVLTLKTSDLTIVYDLASKHWGRWISYTAGSPVSVTSITRSGSTATVVTATAHGILDGGPVKIAGANQSEYNGNFAGRYISATSYAIEVQGAPTSPATGTITSTPYSASYFKFNKSVSYAGVTYLMHETNGHLYQMAASRYEDAGVPIDFYILTARMDGGTDGRKKMPRIRVVGDTVQDFALIRWSDDDCQTFSDFRVVDLSSDRPELRRCGAFVHRNINFRHIGNKPIQLQALDVEVTQ